jgi:hypothetical protein
MNNNLFKVIFSKRTGKLTVVSEITPSTGKTASESTGNGSWGEHFTVNPLSFVLMLTMGTAAFMPANAQVIADGNAPGNQRPRQPTPHHHQHRQWRHPSQHHDAIRSRSEYESILAL